MKMNTFFLHVCQAIIIKHFTMVAFEVYANSVGKECIDLLELHVKQTILFFNYRFVWSLLRYVGGDP